MSVTVKRATLWTIDTSNTPGTLASTLGPLADRRVNLDLVMGYSHPDKSGATIEVYPVSSQHAQKAAKATGFSKSAFPCVTVTGKNRVGLGRQIAAALSDVGINLNFFMAQVVDHKYTGMFSFEAESEADLAVKIIRQAVKAKATRKTATRASTSKRSSVKKKSTARRKTVKKKAAKKSPRRR
ncbi:MAG: hypothetical protein MI923_11865 [Phycisphaerales bacterium]|nr:hypothetical protein [Phycisphaerales bacterium]